jgi:hypothetical protein
VWLVDRAAVGESIVLKQIKAVVVLQKMQSARPAIADDLDANLERGRAQVVWLDVLSNGGLEFSNLCLGLGCKGDVVHKDRADDLHAVLLPDKDWAVQTDAGEAELGENLLEPLEPLPAALDWLDALRQKSALALPMTD